MKTYSNFNEMFNANVNPIHSVFNKCELTDWEGNWEWMIYPDRPLPDDIYTNHGAIFSVWLDRPDLSPEESSAFGDPGDIDTISVFCHFEGCDNEEALINTVAEKVRTYFGSAFECEYDGEGGIFCTSPNQTYESLFEKAKSLAQYLDKEVARIITDACLGDNGKRYDLTNPIKEKFMMPID